MIQRWRRICGDRGSFSYEPLADFLWSFDQKSRPESTFAAASCEIWFDRRTFGSGAG
jgi:hypothetical protein